MKDEIFDRFESFFIMWCGMSWEDVRLYSSGALFTPASYMLCGFPPAAGRIDVDMRLWSERLRGEGYVEDELHEALTSIGKRPTVDALEIVAANLGALASTEHHLRTDIYLAMCGSQSAARRLYDKHRGSTERSAVAFVTGLQAHAQANGSYRKGVGLRLLIDGASRAMNDQEIVLATARAVNAEVVGLVGDSDDLAIFLADREVPQKLMHRFAVEVDAAQMRSDCSVITTEPVGENEAAPADDAPPTDDEFTVALALCEAVGDRDFVDGPHMHDPQFRRDICVEAWAYGGYHTLERFRPAKPGKESKTLEVTVEEIKLEADGKYTIAAPVIERYVLPDVPLIQGHRVLEKIDIKAEARREQHASGFLQPYAEMSGRDLFLTLALDVATDVRGPAIAAYPHAGGVIDALLDRCDEGRPAAFRPTILVGSPGSGKTSLLRFLADALRLPAVVYPCAGVSDSSFAGTPAQWSTRRASVPLEAIRHHLCPNPMIVLDEIEKAGRSEANGSLVHAVLPMLETHTAKTYFEVGLERVADLSRVSFMATANSLDGIPPALRDRFRILTMPDPEPQHVGTIAARILEDVRCERGLHPAFMPPLAPDEVEIVQRAWGGGSLRRLHRAVSATLDARDHALTEMPQ